MGVSANFAYITTTCRFIGEKFRFLNTVTCHVPLQQALSFVFQKFPTVS